MKKSIGVLSILSITVLCSCKRTYNCVCTDQFGNKGITSTTILKGPGVFLKSSVRKDCEKLSSSFKTCVLEKD